MQMCIRIPLLVSNYLCNRANTRANRVFVSALVKFAEHNFEHIRLDFGALLKSITGNSFKCIIGSSLMEMVKDKNVTIFSYVRTYAYVYAQFILDWV